MIGICPRSINNDVYRLPQIFYDVRIRVIAFACLYHALRHFGASLLEQANVPIGSIQRLLGHENRATTELYLHSIGESERKAMDALNERFESFSHTDSHTKKKDSQAAPCKSLI